MKYNIDWIKQQQRENSVEFLFFWGHGRELDGSIGKGCLSQWWECDFVHDSVKYPSAEHWMMACKAELFNDHKVHAQILSTKAPADVKKLGRKIRNFDDALWNEQKYEFVVQGNRLKFGQNARLKAFLLGTGDKVLVEASPYDAIWGIGISVDARGIEDPNNWQGENLLGFALMEVRDFLAK